ncbi:hypothetical protein FLSI110296_14895 [Flavobacterium sinopsychrotolerans]|jgi:hypothetical protein|uniref:DUF2281 domain-containing protein n=1 Tax=Flavobacterium sinopsychrotolerans TaxID=604089 RepID=A0A1H8N4N9_9FLAO|nr:hypothetical protein [Flavobacterium sinopsychrotolerans]SEO24486.1 hypothetical protein SAMN04487942_2203 [Flavobacterium sinopsychrotolerans]
MIREAIIERTIQIINQLPEDKALEIADFADFIIKKYEEQLLTDNIQKVVVESETFNFLNEEDSIYSVSDLKERYQ